MSDDASGLREACGVFGCVSAGPWPSKLDVSTIVCTGLVGLQHRGQESAGIVMGDGSARFNTHKGMGLVPQIFGDEYVMSRLTGSLGIGHTRYSTAGSSNMLNCQPFVVETLHGLIAVAHNGELVNAEPLKQRILQNGTGLSTGSDSELITQLLSRPPPLGEPNGPNWTARLKELMKDTLTSYSLVVMHKDTLYAVRDPFGNRPLALGKLIAGGPAASHQQPGDGEDGPGGGAGSGVGSPGGGGVEGWVVSSESCSFQSVGARHWRDVLPGEIVQITKEGVKSLCIVPRPDNAPAAFCIFEYVYFSRPDSCFEGQMVYTVRERCGRRLALEAPVVDADLVSTVPESATPAALGYAAQSGVPYAEVLCKNRYVGRTFIQPSARLRQLNVSMKFGVLAHNVRGRRIVLVDDSIVRGNTMRPIIRLLKDSGASEVHIRVASPPLKYPCYMGINIPTRGELIANRLSLQELADDIGADSVVYLTLEGLLDSVRPHAPSPVSRPPAFSLRPPGCTASGSPASSCASRPPAFPPSPCPSMSSSQSTNASSATHDLLATCTSTQKLSAASDASPAQAQELDASQVQELNASPMQGHNGSPVEQILNASPAAQGIDASPVQGLNGSLAPKLDANPVQGLTGSPAPMLDASPGVQGLITSPVQGYCTACLTGVYPVSINW